MPQRKQRDLVPENGLMVRDMEGHYRAASPEQILTAARVIVDQTLRRGVKFGEPKVAKDYLRAKLGGRECEIFAALFLDAQNRLIEYAEIFRGTVSESRIYPREIVKESLARNAAALIVAHNHPSGLPEPSLADRTVTTLLCEALALVDVRLLDHILVAGHTAVSFREIGAF
jgi:DNA repair protein RadC